MKYIKTILTAVMMMIVSHQQYFHRTGTEELPMDSIRMYQQTTHRVSSQNIMVLLMMGIPVVFRKIIQRVLFLSIMEALMMVLINQLILHHISLPILLLQTQQKW